MRPFTSLEPPAPTMQRDDPTPPPAPPANTQFGVYRLMDRLAVGGMAELFRAIEPRSAGEPRVVVVKRMLPAIAAEADAHGMFAEEARLGASIRHRNVVEVLDFGTEQGHPYLALEFVRGLDLWRLQRSLRRRSEELSVEVALYLLRELLSGLEAVHQARDPEGEPLGIVHRDVSPSNVLLSIHGDVKLGDLGIARSQRQAVTAHGPLSERAKGKLGYLAPEQVAGEEVDRRADVFSAGVVAAELLMGRPLFAGGSELAVLLAIRDGHVHPFEEFSSSLPAGLGTAVLRALAREPVSRYASAAAFWAALSPWLRTSDEVLTQELARLVTEAMAGSGSGPSDELDVRPTPLADDAVTPHTAHPSKEQVTAEVPHVPYRLRLTSGEALGPWPYAKVVEGVALGQIGPHDLVRVGDDSYRRVEEITGLRRHLPSSSLTPTVPDSKQPDPAPAAPDAVHSLTEASFVEALARSALRRETGLWLCVRGGVRKEVYVAKGVPEFVTSNLAGELLGEYLVHERVITRGELDMALAVMPRFEGRLGDTLTALGLVEPVVLFQHIATQVRDKLLDLFVWNGGDASFYRGVPPPASGFPLGLDPWSILDEGIGRRIEAGLEPSVLEWASGLSVRVSPPPQDVAHGALPTTLRRLLNTLEQPREMHDLVPLLDPERGRDDAAALRALLLLARLGAVRLVSPG